MTRIGLLSDTHGYLDERIAHHLRGCDEVWHAGDFGDARVVDELQLGSSHYLVLPVFQRRHSTELMGLRVLALNNR